MSGAGLRALEVTVTAPVVSFRDRLYAGVQVTLPCPPPSTVGGLLAAAAGGWQHVGPGLRIAYAFHAAGEGVDLETYHPLDGAGKQTSPAPRNRQFLARAELTVWLTEDLETWKARLRRPVWPLRLGRSQDLVGVRVTETVLAPEPGAQRGALVPGETGGSGLLLRLPTAVSAGRERTRWDSYRFDAAGSCPDPVDGSCSTPTGQAVALLPPLHPDTALSPCPPPQKAAAHPHEP
ncbi:CRISPR-associated protein Cas5 [Streptomyces sp. NPDC054796]